MCLVLAPPDPVPPRFPVPRWRVLAWLIDGRTTVPEIKDGLRSTLFRRMSPILAVSVAFFSLLFIAPIRHPSGLFAVWAVLGGALETIRLVLIALVARAIRKNSLWRERRLVELFVLSNLLWAANLGLGCFLCLWSQDPVLTSFSVVLSVGVIGALSARNPGSPRLSGTQMMLILVPLTVGILLNPDPSIRLLALMAPPYVWGMRAINQQLHSDYVDMLTAQHDNRKRALHCGLTGLPNASHFYETLRAAITSHHPIAVLALDLDGFKVVNDHHGHPAGDALLKQVAGRMAEFASPWVLVARIGGDEFALVLQQHDRVAAEDLAQRLIRALSVPYRLADVSVTVSASIGIAACSTVGLDAVAFYALADKALYRAKAAGKGTWRVQDGPAPAGSAAQRWGTEGRACPADAA